MHSLQRTCYWEQSFLNRRARSGIVFPIAKSMAEAYDSRPGESARKLGAFLMVLVYQCDVIVCAMFLTARLPIR